jgi:hypothetical protein
MEEILFGIIFLETAIIFGIFINELALRGKSLRDLKITRKIEWNWIKTHPLDTFKIVLFFGTFIFTTYLGLTFYQINASITHSLMVENLSVSDRTIGEGLNNLISPAIGILFGIAFFTGALILTTFSEISFKEELVKINQRLTEIVETLSKEREK